MDTMAYSLIAAASFKTGVMWQHALHIQEGHYKVKRVLSHTYQGYSWPAVAPVFILTDSFTLHICLNHLNVIWI